MDSLEYLDYTIDEGCAEILLDRPEVLNALNQDMLEELNVAIDDAIDNSSVYAIVLSGRGRGFCSGADIRNMEGRSDRDDPLAYRHSLETIQNVIRKLYTGPKPTIAAINGPAVGVGCNFALSCDLRVMSESAFLCQQFVNIGLVPGDCGAWLLPRLIGESKAKEYLLTGKDITPEEAQRDGLVVEITDDDSTLEAAQNLAGTLIGKTKNSIQGTKALIDITQSFDDHARLAFEKQWKCVNDEEHYEAVDAFRNEREPEFNREL